MKVSRVFVPSVVCVAVATALPFVLAFLYIHPSYDDQWSYYEIATKGILSSQRDWYVTHSGRFSSNLILGLVAPLIHATFFYRLACALCLVGLTLGMQQFFKTGLGISRQTSWLLCSLLLTSWFTIIPSPAEGLYWLGGSVTYTLGTGASLFALSEVLRLRAQGARALAWCSLLIAVSVGMNEINLFVVNAGLLFIVFQDLRRHRADRRWTASCMAASLISSCLAVLAPGNWNRLELSREEISTAGHFLPAVRSAFVELATDWYSLLLFSPFIIVLLCVSILYKPDVDTRSVGNRMDAVEAALAVLAVSGAIYFILFTYHYAQGIRTIGRVLNVVYLLMMLATVMLVSSFHRLRSWTEPTAPVLVKLLLVAALAVGIIRPGSRARSAYMEWTRHMWARYDKEATRRVELLSRHPGQDMVVPEFSAPPATLFVFDISSNSAQRYNQYYAYFYGLRSLRTQPER